MSQTTIALPAVLKAVNGILTSLSAGKEIKVIFAGTPCTDGKTVYLGEPLLQSQDALDAYLSHGTHEIHHVLYSDFDEVASLGGLHSLVNALEDVRIDAIGYKKYPGGYLWRNEHFSKMARAGQLPKINEHTSPGRASLLYLLLVHDRTDAGIRLLKALFGRSKKCFRTEIRSGAF